MEYWWLVLGKPPAYSSARLGHIPSLPWESQLPLKPCLTLQSFNFEGNCDSSDSLLDFCYVSLCSSDLLRKCGLLAHTSAAFLKNCCTEKLLVACSSSLETMLLEQSIATQFTAPCSSFNDYTATSLPQFFRLQSILLLFLPAQTPAA